MKDLESKRVWEKKVITEMIALYCAKQHAGEPRDEQGLCPDCAELAAYACDRSDHCPRMEVKTFCSNCPVHCYKPSMREKIREVMRFSGPRMLWHHPVDAVRHLYWSKREQRELAEKGR